MLLNDFDYNLPKELIAQAPLEKRSASRLLHYNIKKDAIAHIMASNIAEILTDNDVLVFNNTKVIPARLLGHKKTGGKIEVLIEKVLSSKQARAMLRSNSSIKEGLEVIVHESVLKVAKKQGMLFDIELQQGNFNDLISLHGHIPLPPYIEREDDSLDKQRYQTVFAKYAGAIAAPTAGLHFDDNLLELLRNKGVQLEYITLHVGLGTFLPVKVDNIFEHKMHNEEYVIEQQVSDRLNHAKSKGKRIIAVGTTVVRALESAYNGSSITIDTKSTDIFIYPGFEFKVIDGLFTNFHLPKSTLMMLVSAFAGKKNIISLYEQAVRHKYRFFSYGDLMFLENRI